MMEKIISRLDKYPEFMTTLDLVELGIFTSSDSAYINRARGKGPVYIKINHSIKYPKVGIIEWIERNLNTPSITKN